MTEASSPSARPLTLTEAAIPIVALIVLVGLSFYLFGDAGAKGPNQVALVLALQLQLVALASTEMVPVPPLAP
jgi:NhaC family Na+:H+ antiporter